MINGVENLYDIKIGESTKKGIAKLSKYEFREKDNKLFNAMQIMNGGGALFTMEDGVYVRLHVKDELMMSDTRMEKLTNLDFINEAKGKVLIAGLGVGLILNGLKTKINSGEVTEIVVIEKYQDVIDLISPKFPNVKIICADIFNYETKEKFDTIYFDIWATIGTDNLDEIKKLHNKFKFNKVKGGWMNSWMKEYLQAQKRRENRENNRFW